jgi:hypothetical protein
MTFPQYLCALDALEHLDMHGNQLTTIPRAVGTMPSLKALLLGGNPLSFPPSGVVAQGPQAVLEYVRRHRQSDLLSSDAERSLKQVAQYRDRLASSIDAQEETREDGDRPEVPQRNSARAGGARARAAIEQAAEEVIGAGDAHAQAEAQAGAQAEAQAHVLGGYADISEAQQVDERERVGGGAHVPVSVASTGVRDGTPTSRPHTAAREALVDVAGLGHGPSASRPHHRQRSTNFFD